MRWWFSWSFKSFSLRYSIVCTIINFLFASLKLVKLLNNFVKGFEVITILLPLRWLQNLTLSHVEKNPFLCCFFSRFGLVCLQSFEKVKIWARKIFYFEKIQYKYKEMQDFKRFRNCWKIYKKVPYEKWSFLMFISARIHIIHIIKLWNRARICILLSPVAFHRLKYKFFKNVCAFQFSKVGNYVYISLNTVDN